MQMRLKRNREMHLDTGFKQAHKLGILQPKVRQKASCAEVKEIPSSKYNLFPIKIFQLYHYALEMEKDPVCSIEPASLNPILLRYANKRTSK